MKTYRFDQNAPCKDCPNRAIACHGSCEDYLNFKVRREELLQRIQEFKVSAYDYVRRRDNCMKIRGGLPK